jgi:hypothetical protein
MPTDPEGLNVERVAQMHDALVQYLANATPSPIEAEVALVMALRSCNRGAAAHAGARPLSDLELFEYASKYVADVDAGVAMLAAQRSGVKS